MIKSSPKVIRRRIQRKKNYPEEKEKNEKRRRTA